MQQFGHNAPLQPDRLEISLRGKIYAIQLSFARQKTTRTHHVRLTFKFMIGFAWASLTAFNMPLKNE